MTKPLPFDDQQFTLGGLTVESAADRVALSGSVDLGHDQNGLRAAKTLVAYLTDLVAVLERENASSPLPAEAVIEAPVVKPNPFAGGGG